MARFEKFSWQEFDDACRKIAAFARKRMRKGTAIDKVYGIPRGGLPVAVRVSHLLGLELIVDESMVDKSTLVVDEICDTGKTLRKFSQKKRCALIATIYHRDGAVFVPDYYLRRKGDAWVLFPWETEKTTWKGKKPKARGRRKPT